MPVCQGCGGSYEDQVTLCPYCGRAKPSPKIININIQTPQDSSNCPKAAGVPHRVEMVSGIVRRGNSQLSSLLSLPVPAYSSSKYTWQWIFIIYPGFGIAAIVGAIPALIFLGLTWIIMGETTGWMSIIYGFLLAIGAIIANIFWFKMFKRKNLARQEKDKIRNRPLKEHYDKKRMIWKRLFYCFQDDIVFDPETRRFCAPNRLDQFLEDMIQMNPQGSPPPISR